MRSVECCEMVLSQGLTIIQINGLIVLSRDSGSK